MFIVTLKNGTVLKETEFDWKQIKEKTNNLKDITSLQIKRGETFYTVSVDGSNVDLIQLKRNILNMITSEDKLVERVVGFVIKDAANNPLYAVKMSIGEKTGGVQITLEKKTEKGWIAL